MANTYPVHLRGELTTPPGNWVWIFKWLLIIPHIIVLCFLGFAAFFVSVYAFFSILFTGKYPKGAFDFNVGVMRWGWRVGFYSYNALGTDKYPPFSMDPDPNYPADLEIEYPEKLTNWKVLVKWFLAIPHCIILAFFNGGRGGGLIPLVTFFNGVHLLFTGKIHDDLFKFAMGMNRWSYRVMAYIMMRDEYPPFTLD
jgi:hypothetical protein